jgi:hypothetical protein
MERTPRRPFLIHDPVPTFSTTNGFLRFYFVFRATIFRRMCYKSHLARRFRYPHLRIGIPCLWMAAGGTILHPHYCRCSKDQVVGSLRQSSHARDGPSTCTRTSIQCLDSMQLRRHLFWTLYVRIAQLDRAVTARGGNVTSTSITHNCFRHPNSG